jgi:hypothetical protein
MAHNRDESSIGANGSLYVVHRAFPIVYIMERIEEWQLIVFQRLTRPDAHSGHC